MSVSFFTLPVNARPGRKLVKIGIFILHAYAEYSIISLLYIAFGRIKGDRMDQFRRGRFLWHLLLPAMRRWLQRKFNFDAEICREDGPFLVLCNHNTDWDPVLLACAFPNYMSYVGSEHIFRWRFFGKLIVWLMAPIARLKGDTLPRITASTSTAIVARSPSSISRKKVCARSVML